MHGYWSEWRKHDGSGLPEGLNGATVEVRTTGPITGNAPDGMSALGLAGVTLIRSWRWTPESRALPVWHPRWTSSQPIDEYRVWEMPSGRIDAEVFDCEGASKPSGMGARNL